MMLYQYYYHYHSPWLRTVIWCKRMLFILQALSLIQAIPLHHKLFAAQKSVCVLNCRMPFFHAEGRRAGAVDGRGVTDRRKKERQIRIIRIAHKPLWRSTFHSVKIHKIQDLTHQLPAAAGDHYIAVRRQIHLRKLPAAVPGCGADPD